MMEGVAHTHPSPLQALKDANDYAAIQRTGHELVKNKQCNNKSQC